MGIEKYVYFFQQGQSEGSLEIRNILGNKGARLADMAGVGISVPPGFIISAEVCKYYLSQDQYPTGLKDEVDVNLGKLERITGKKFGDPENPLLVAARSGAAASMPGMMDTVLNVGLNRIIVDTLIKTNKAPWFVWDCYRRLLQSFGTAVCEIEDDEFDLVIRRKVNERNLASETQLEVKDMQEIAHEFEGIFRKHGKSFPENVDEQLWMSIGRVFQSWNTPRAIEYRKIKKISGDLAGTAVTVQTMVFGNSGDNSCSGVVFSRNISTGDRGLYGEYLKNAQGEDVVAGTRAPKNIKELREEMPEVYLDLEETLRELEERYKDVQDIEFTVEEGKLFILQSRTAKQTPKAAIKIAVDMVEEGLVTKEEVLSRISTEQLKQLIVTQLDSSQKKVIATGIPISPGIVTGRVVFTPKDALEWTRKGEKVILVRQKTSPADVAGIKVAEGLVTSKGGTSSHAAIICRDLGKPSVVGCQEISIECKEKQFTTTKDTLIREGDKISLDGSSGEVMLGEVSAASLGQDEDLNKLLKLAESSPAGQEIRDYLTKITFPKLSGPSHPHHI